MANRFEYGEGPMQYGVFRSADGAPRGTVVLIHGGFWRGTPQYFDGPTPLAEALVARGWHVWQLEYRQLPNGGGWPATLDDTAAGIEHLAVVAATLGARLGPVITVGHSAGGHLAVWALRRPGAVLPLAGAVSLAGVLHLRLGERKRIGHGAVVHFLGGSSADHPERYDAADPIAQIEPRLPVRIVHGRRDDVVPMNQSDTYVAAAAAAGQDVALAVVDADHMALIDPGHPAFHRVVDALDEIRTTAEGCGRIERMSTSVASAETLERWTAWIGARLIGLTAPQGNLALVETRWYEPGTTIPAADLVPGSATETVTTLRRTDLDSGRPQEGIRRWDADSAAMHAFEGVDRYAYDADWVVEGRYVPGDPDRTVPFEHIRDNGGSRELAVPGEILVRIADVDYRLNAFDDGGTLLLVFGDPTNGDETYATGRFLFVDLAEFGSEGAVELDFNRAFVPPCGFSDQFNCPLPPPSNRIAVPVRAGERIPRFAAGFDH